MRICVSLYGEKLRLLEVVETDNLWLVVHLRV